MGSRVEHGHVLVRPFDDGDEEAVLALWESAGLTRPWNDPRKDIARKLKVQREWFLVAVRGNEVIGSVMAGYDGHRGWVNYLAVLPSLRREGVGRALMHAVEAQLSAAGCPKINLQVRATNQEAIGFYRALGYSSDDVVSLGRRLKHDEPPATNCGSRSA
jgi:ribosomal protein S18 acetylase RimI-like enzyme